MLDLAILNSDTGSLGIYLGFGNGNFQEARLSDTDLTTGIQPTDLAVGFFNQDSINDLVLTNADGVSTFLGLEQPFPDTPVEVRNEAGLTVGTVRYWEDVVEGGGINPVLDRTSQNGRFIVFNIPPRLGFHKGQGEGRW